MRKKIPTCNLNCPAIICHKKCIAHQIYNDAGASTGSIEDMENEIHLDDEDHDKNALIECSLVMLVFVHVLSHPLLPNMLEIMLLLHICLCIGFNFMSCSND